MKMRKRTAAQKHHLEHEIEGGAAAAVAGAALGSVAGAPGLIAGAIAGGAFGIASAALLEENMVSKAGSGPMPEEAIPGAKAS